MKKHNCQHKKTLFKRYKITGASPFTNKKIQYIDLVRARNLFQAKRLAKTLLRSHLYQNQS